MLNLTRNRGNTGFVVRVVQVIVYAFGFHERLVCEVDWLIVGLQEIKCRQRSLLTFFLQFLLMNLFKITFRQSHQKNAIEFQLCSVNFKFVRKPFPRSLIQEIGIAHFARPREAFDGSLECIAHNNSTFERVGERRMLN